MVKVVIINAGVMFNITVSIIRSIIVLGGVSLVIISGSIII